MIENIKIEKLYPHPDNPRIDVGDVTELAASIKAKGVLQNLTVIEGGKGVPEGTDGYTVIIGHRRLAAAKEAGLTELPCTVVEMSEKDQIATMLLENMQRADLTISEQAHGMQMMFDLGETKESIAEKTGLSQSTVSKRLKIATLDAAKLKAAESRGGTLLDLLRAAEIKNEKERNKVIDAVGTGNFNYTYQDAFRKQTEKEKMPIIKKEMKRIGAVKDENVYSWTSGYEKICEIKIEDFTESSLPKKIKPGKLIWNTTYSSVHLMRKEDKAETPVRHLTEKEKAVRKANRELTELNRQAYELRKDFVLNFRTNKEKDAILNVLLLDQQIEILQRGWSNSYDRRHFYELTGHEDLKERVVTKEYWSRCVNENVGRAILALLLCAEGENPDAKSFCAGYNETMPWLQARNVEGIYKILGHLGYEMSDMEKSLIDGTHPAYKYGGKE